MISEGSCDTEDWGNNCSLGKHETLLSKALKTLTLKVETLNFIGSVCSDSFEIIVLLTVKQFWEF